MDKIYAIVEYGTMHIVNRNGRLAIYSTKELADEDRRNMPDSWTDYQHFEVIEIPLANADTMLFKSK